jgi:hypothetical protein
MSVSRKIAGLRVRWRKWRHGLPRVGMGSLLRAVPEVEAPIVEAICMPPYYWATDHDDYAPAMQLARGLRARLIVELGTAHGNTTANLCRHCPDAEVVTVNAPAEVMTGVGTTFALTREQIGHVYRGAGFGGRVKQLFANTLDLDLSGVVPARSVQLAIVDACHDPEYVENDFRKVEPYVADDGVMLLHDTHPSMEGHLRGSYAACMELRRQGYDIRWLEGTWWGVWVRDWSRFPLA